MGSTVARVQRVAVIGCGGSGKTTLANALAECLEIPVIHIDSYYWQFRDGQRVESTPAEWAGCHRELVAREAWVMDGMKLGVLAERLERADTVVYLDLATSACLIGILRRRLRYRGRLRPDVGVYDRVSWQFLRWIWSFRRRQRPELLRALARFEGQAFVLHRRSEVQRFPESVEAQHRHAAAT